MHRQVVSSVVVPVAALLVLAGCTSETEPAPTARPSHSTVSASPTPEGPSGIERTIELGGAEMTVVVEPIKVDGDAGLLSFQVSVADDAPPDFTYSPGLAFSSGAAAELDRVQAVDLQAGTVLAPALDASGSVVGSRDGEQLTAGRSIALELLIAAPEGELVDVLLPNFGLLRNVPVVEGDVPAPSQYDVTGEVTFAKLPLQTFVQAYDNNSSASAEGETATVTLGSDVLFATDQFALSDGAVQVVDQAAAQIAAAGVGGEVLVVGHTDDQASDDYNLDLSRKRAASVAERLTGILGTQFSLTVDGKGESEPVAEGTSPEARAANRRVEIRFTVTSQEALLSTGQAPVPEPDGPVASGDGAVEFTVDGVVSTARMLSVRRIAGYLVGEMEITRVSGGGAYVPALLSGEDRRHVLRGFPVRASLESAVGVTLLSSTGRVYPAEHLIAGTENRRAILGEQDLTPALDDGETAVVTVVWPDIGGETVDIDVPKRFRITDVPVED